MTRALERHHAGEARVIPVVLEPCLWQDIPFGKQNAVPADGRPVSKFPNHHDAFVEIAGAIRDALPAPRDAARTPSIPQETAVERSPRSSNLRVKRQFTDEDKDRFLSESFHYNRRFFEGSIEELAMRNTEITGTVQRVDTARLYRQGREVASCTIWQGSQTGFGGGINFVHGIKRATPIGLWCQDSFPAGTSDCIAAAVERQSSANHCRKFTKYAWHPYGMFPSSMIERFLHEFSRQARD